jgi:hypothetical protein
VNAVRILLATAIAKITTALMQVLTALVMVVNASSLILILWLLPENEATELRKEIEDGRV